MVSLLEDTKPAKPHFRFAREVWSCATWAGRWRIGFGYTVKEAWNDWRRQK